MRFVAYVCDEHRKYKIVPGTKAKNLQVAQVDDRLLSTLCSVSGCGKTVRTFISIEVRHADETRMPRKA